MIDEAAFLEQLENSETSMLMRCSYAMRDAASRAAAIEGISREEWMRRAVRAQLPEGLR